MRGTLSRPLIYVGIFATTLVVSVAVFVCLPEELVELYLQPGTYADELLHKAEPAYSLLVAWLDRVFVNATVFGLSLSSSALWLPVAFAFVLWACVLSALVVSAYQAVRRYAGVA